MKDELARRKSNVQKLRAYFDARPLTWIDAVNLELVAGRQAWRTRVSELRVKLQAANEGTIENRLDYDQHGRVVASYYRFLPYTPIGRDPGTPTPALPLYDDGPWSQR